jgi:hypothetical protein
MACSYKGDAPPGQAKGRVQPQTLRLAAVLRRGFAADRAARAGRSTIPGVGDVARFGFVFDVGDIQIQIFKHESSLKDMYDSHECDGCSIRAIAPSAFDRVVPMMCRVLQC